MRIVPSVLALSAVLVAAAALPSPPPGCPRPASPATPRRPARKVRGTFRPAPFVRVVTIGERNPLEAELLSGLPADAEVVLHPADTLADGSRIERR